MYPTVDLPADQKTYNTFDFAPRVGYDSDHVNWRFSTFFDFLNGEVQGYAVCAE